MQSKLIFVDLEPGGHDPRRHPIVQIAAIAVDEHLNEIEGFEAKLQFDETQATKASLRKASYSRSRWAREAYDSRTVALEFSAFLKRHATVPVVGRRSQQRDIAQLVAHNAEFDSAFIQRWYELENLYLPARFQALCTLQRAEWFFAERSELPRPDNFRLLTLCQYFDVPINRLTAHNALTDVRATIGLYRAIRDAEGDGNFMPPPHSLRPRRASRFAAAF